MNNPENNSDIEEAQERAHFRSVVKAFKYYKLCSLDRIHKSENIISVLPERHQKRLEKYKTYLVQFKKCLDINNSVVNEIITDVDTMFENVDHSIELPANGKESYGCDYAHFDFMSNKQTQLQSDVEKVQSVLKNIIRDWSDVGAQEREQCYKPIVDGILQRFPPDNYDDPSEIKIVVPGAGLGRLAWEIASYGFTCQGNEFSLYMLFASNFVLNKCSKINEYMLHPWVHQYVNNLTCEHQSLGARFPDVRPCCRASNNFSMAAGDFLKVYTESETWDCVATCFFIDCAPNVIDFIERIFKILKPGGYWINLGPLLYHYSDMPSENSVEPPYDILLEIIKDVGFDIEKEHSGVKTKYAQNPNSMLKHEYDSVFFVCQKPYC